MTETKTEKRSLRYDFCASEVHDLSIQLAGIINVKEDDNI